MSRLKNSLYEWAVRRNENVRYEYERYVIEHIDDHEKHRFRHWKILWKLNCHYCIKKQTKPLLYTRENDSTNRLNTENKDNIKSQSETIQKQVLDRPESSIRLRPLPIHEVKVYASYDIISFDIFDTLIFRPFSKPSDLFMLVGEKLEIMDFTTIRIEAEEIARKENEMRNGNREITIYDIYRIISYKTGISIENGVKAEYEMECELCFPNPYMKRIYELLYYMKKRIIFVSDMYYPEEMMKKILKKCGYSNYEKMFVSCDFNCSKSNSELYKYVLRYAEKSKVIHIGDNVKSDVEIPRKFKIRSVHYQNVNEKGKKYRPTEMSYLIGSAYSGIINAYIHNGLNCYSPYFEYGFIYAGIYILGYCSWIHSYVKEHHIDKILFLSRDGDIYHKIYKTIYNDTNSEYVYWSRIPTLKLTAENNRFLFIKSLINDKARDLYQTKIKDLFIIAGISELLQYRKNYGLKEEEYITPYNEKMIERLLCEHWNEVLECYKKENDEIKTYYEDVIGTHKKIAIVDVGWSGNIVLGLKKLIEEKWKIGCEVDCLLAATRGLRETSLETLELKKKVNCYIFSTIDNTDLHKKHMTTNRRLNSFLFEMMTQSNSSTFEGIFEGNFKFEIPETENFEHNKEIHEGIIMFAKVYTETFKNYPYMWQIPGRDAYIPFSNLVKDLTFIKKYFSDYVFGRGVLSTAGEDGKETVKQVLDNANL